MNVYVRTDATARTGAGHFMRCIALGQALGSRGASLTFLMREPGQSIAETLSAEGFGLHRLQESEGAASELQAGAGWLTAPWEFDAEQTIHAMKNRRADWIVVDHYGIDRRWEARVKSAGCRVLAIDDLANRAHDADIVVDHNIGHEQTALYQDLVTPSCRMLLGPRYALLRQEFSRIRQTAMPRTGPVKRILVMFGGSDPGGEAIKAVRGMRMLNRQSVRMDVIAGSLNKMKNELRAACAEDPRINFFDSLQQVAVAMSAADLAIGACGISALERSSMYLPAIAVVIADNQRDIGRELASRGIAEVLGWHENVRPESYATAIETLCGNPDRLREMSVAAGAIVDAQGADRVADIVGDRS